MIVRNGKLTSYTDTVESLVLCAAEHLRRPGYREYLVVRSERFDVSIQGRAAGGEIWTASEEVAVEAARQGNEVRWDSVPGAGSHEIVFSGAR